jgi:hypothetical protein
MMSDVLQRDFNREFEPEVSINMGGNFYKTFDAATKERDIVVECKAMTYRANGGNPQAKISAMREACSDLRSIPGDSERFLILMHAPHPTKPHRETLGRYFVRLNMRHLERITVLEMLENGGELVCLHGVYRATTAPLV